MSKQQETLEETGGGLALKEAPAASNDPLNAVPEAGAAPAASPEVAEPEPTEPPDAPTPANTPDDEHTPKEELAPAGNGNKPPPEPPKAPPVAKDPDEEEEKREINVHQDISPQASTDVIVATSKADKIVVHNYSTAKEAWERKEDTPQFDDPTNEFPSKPLGIPDFRPVSEIEPICEALQKERIVAISCLDEGILHAAAYALLEMPGLEHRPKRMLVFDWQNASRTELKLEMFLEREVAAWNDAIIVIHVTEQSFLQSMRGTPLRISQFKEVLQQKNMMLLCLIDGELLHEAGAHVSRPFKFHYQEIDFLPHLLNQHFLRVEAEALEVRIRRQREHGLWGEEGDDREFYELIFGYYREGKRHLLAKVEAWDQSLEESSSRERKRDIRQSETGTDYGLTMREKEVLHEMVEGYTQREIADHLHLSPYTVNSHVRHIYEKLHVHSKVEAVAKALKERLI